MNENQQGVLSMTAVAIMASIAYCPYWCNYYSGSSVYGWFWSPPDNTVIDWGRLALEWVGIGIAASIMYAVNGDKK